MLKIVVFAQIVFGFRFFVRNLEILHESSLITKLAMTKIGTLFVLWNVLGIIFLSPWPLMVFFWLQLPNILLCLSKKWIRMYRETCFRRHFLGFLNKIILQMRSGNSFRQAVVRANETNSSFVRTKMDDIMKIVVFSQHSSTVTKSSFVDFIISEFKLVDTHSHRSLQRLLNLRKKIQIEEEFRHRSGQVLNQIRLQSTVITVLYSALLIFVVVQYGFMKHSGIIYVSTFMFIVGLLFVFKLGRKLKWKV